MKDTQLYSQILCSQKSSTTVALNCGLVYAPRRVAAYVLHTSLLNAQQWRFVEYVLCNYMDVGVDELDVSKLSTVLNAKYGSIHAAQEALGSVQEIQNTFVTFQAELYKEFVG